MPLVNESVHSRTRPPPAGGAATSRDRDASLLRNDVAANRGMRRRVSRPATLSTIRSIHRGASSALNSRGARVMSRSQRGSQPST